VAREELAGNPLDVLARWAAEAGGLPAAMTLATADADGAPHARTVLATVVDATSLRFHSSVPTTKTKDIAANPRVSAVFLWAEQGRQVVLTGTAAELDAATSRAAFPTRPRPLQVLACVYEDLTPDEPLAPGALQQAYDAAADTVEMPPSWTTVRLEPVQMDFWQVGAPPHKTRFVKDGEGWRTYEVLP
jgi:pyridoxamine 5'-phosphate oxidase